MSVSYESNLTQNPEIRELAQAYVQEMAIARAVELLNLQRLRELTDDEQFDVLLDEAIDYKDELDRARESNEVYTPEYMLTHPAPSTVVNGRWHEFLGTTFTNNMYCWFLRFDGGNQDGFLVYYNPNIKTNTAGQLITDLETTDPVFFADCQEVVGRTTPIILSGLNGVPEVEPEIKVIHSWERDAKMTEALSRIAVLASASELSPTTLFI